MFLEISFIDNPIVLFVVAICLFIFIISICIYNFVTDKKVKKFLSDSSHNRTNNEYTFKFDFEKDVITMYCRSKNMMYCKFRFADFRKMIIPDQESKFNDWLNSIKNANKINKNSVSSFAIKIEELFGDKYRWIRFNVISLKRPGKVVYCGAVGVSSYRKVKQQTNDIVNLNMFKLRVEEGCADSKLEGTIYCVNCNMLDVIRRRYGQEVANQYLLVLLHSFHELNNIKTLVGHYKNDSFLIYKASTSKTLVADGLRKILDSFNRFIEFDKYQFEVKITSGAAILGEFNSENINPVDSAIEQANKASLKSYGEVVLYDAQMAYEEQLEKRSLSDLNKAIDDANFLPSFYPIISLNNGLEFGYFCEMNYSSKDKIIIKKSHEIELRRKFYNASFRSYLDHYLDRSGSKKKKLFIFCDLDMLSTLEEIYESRIDYLSVNLVAIIKSYNQILESEEGTIAKLNKIKKNHIQIGVVAEEEMQKSIHPAIECMDYVVFPEQMIKMVGIDQRMRLCVGSIIELLDNKYSQFNIQPIAWNVNNFSQAEILKSLGIVNMNGPLFDSRSKDGNSIRRINKLMEEN